MRSTRYNTLDTTSRGHKCPRANSNPTFIHFQASLFEGGIRVPGLLEWPQGVPERWETHTPVGVYDYLPTALEAPPESDRTALLSVPAWSNLCGNEHDGKNSPRLPIHR